MKAYMSGTGGGEGGHPDFADAAVAEARRILAETEPASRTGESHHWKLVDGQFLPVSSSGFWAAANMSAKIALAETLAAFVADEHEHTLTSKGY